MTVAPAQLYFSGGTVDDVLRAVIDAIRLHGIEIAPTRGKATELTGVLLELSNPRARLSRTETRGKVFSCVGELCWYLAKSADADFVSYYLPRYRNDAEGDILHGAYGPRLFGLHGQDQISNVIALLKQNSASRRAVIQLFDATDLAEEHKDVPCTCSLQFLVRGGAVHMFSAMRSNDVFLGLPHDVFCFTMIQELVARTLKFELGIYKHAVGSLHLYHEHRAEAEAFLDEGWQPTDQPMAVMPVGDPWPSVELLIRLERQIRTGQTPDPEVLARLDPYWADLVRLLQVFADGKAKNVGRMRSVLGLMSSDVFDPFITAKIAAATS